MEKYGSSRKRADAGTVGSKRGRFFYVALFFLGCIVGVFLIFGLDILLSKKYFALKAGRVFDIDFVYLKGEEPIRGHVISEDKDGIVFETMPESTVVFPREEINKIDYNYYTRYLKKAW